MKMTGNTVLITGGGSGIGRGLAEALHRSGNRIVIAGRRAALLSEVCAANPGMAWVELDVTDPASVDRAVAQALEQHPTLDVLINGAGVQSHEGVDKPIIDEAMLRDTFEANVFGPIRLSNALIPHLLTRPGATIINVTSMLGDLPIAVIGTYCASKAALHSWTLSLRYKLRHSNIAVRELAPPYVQTPLLNAADDPRAMPLDLFIAETMVALASDDPEILVPRARERRDMLRIDELGAMTRMNNMVGDV